MTTVTAGREVERPLSVRGSLVRLVIGAVVLWAVVAGVGWLLVSSGDGAAVLRWDQSVERWFAARRTDSWNGLTDYVTAAGGTEVIVGLGILVALALRLTLHRWREVLFVLAALAGEVSIFLCATLVIHRHRPDVPHLDTSPPTSSFPSGHTAAAVTLYVGLAILAWRLSQHAWVRMLAVVVAVTIPVAVALSRMYRGMHFPTDVLTGAMIGLVWLTISAAVVLRGAP
ncbi:MAG: phosphatase PAP2 family protein [Actinomycetota bacterium]